MPAKRKRRSAARDPDDELDNEIPRVLSHSYPRGTQHVQYTISHRGQIFKVLENNTEFRYYIDAYWEDRKNAPETPPKKQRRKSGSVVLEQNIVPEVGTSQQSSPSSESSEESGSSPSLKLEIKSECGSIYGENDLDTLADVAIREAEKMQNHQEAQVEHLETSVAVMSNNEATKVPKKSYKKKKSSKKHKKSKKSASSEAIVPTNSPSPGPSSSTNSPGSPRVLLTIPSHVVIQARRWKKELEIMNENQSPTKEESATPPMTGEQRNQPTPPISDQHYQNALAMMDDLTENELAQMTVREFTNKNIRITMELMQREQVVKEAEKELDKRALELEERLQEVAHRSHELEQRSQEVEHRSQELEQQSQELKQHAQDLIQRERNLQIVYRQLMSNLQACAVRDQMLLGNFTQTETNIQGTFNQRESPMQMEFHRRQQFEQHLRQELYAKEQAYMANVKRMHMESEAERMGAQFACQLASMTQRPQPAMSAPPMPPFAAAMNFPPGMTQQQTPKPRAKKPRQSKAKQPHLVLPAGALFPSTSQQPEMPAAFSSFATTAAPQMQPTTTSQEEPMPLSPKKRWLMKAMSMDNN